ncbi:uncharacterized protein LOC115165110 [Salmo trutta]|uniref:uncharacterized protein LOC115165110 n=1 Tax=Salmo trutta TaxID=8032 RepID=UPI0011316535|nr:uncharacterized protein LOC115165110 [Salmo trutta]
MMLGARQKIKEESDKVSVVGSGVPGREGRAATAVDELEGHMAGVKLSVSKMAELAGFPSHRSRADVTATGISTSPGAEMAGPAYVNRDGSGLLPLATVAAKLPKFNGQGKWEVFFTQFELLARAGRWSDETKALQLALSLAEEASECLLTLAPDERGDYGALVEALGGPFGSDAQPNMLRIELSNKKRLKGESLKALASGILSLTRRAYATMPIGVQDELARDSFIRALSSTELGKHVQMADPPSLRAAVETARKRELIWGEGVRVEVASQPEVRAAVAGVPGVTKPDLATFSGSVADSPVPGKRRRVLAQGAARTHPPAPEPTVSKRGTQQRRQEGGDLLPQGVAAAVFPSPVVVVGRTTVGDFCNVIVKVEGVECLALVDTGSTVTLVRPDILPVGVRVEPTLVQLRTVTGELAPMLGKCQLSVTVGGRTVGCPAWVAAVQDPCILGMDFLKNCGAQLDLASGTLRLSGGPTVGMSTSGGPAGGRAVPPSSSKLAETPPVIPAAPLVVVPFQQLSPAATAFTPHHGASTGSSVAQNTLAPSPHQPDGGKEEAIDAVEAVWLKNCQGLDERQQRQLKQLLLDFKDSFAWGEDEVGQTHLVQHEIDTGDARPIKIRPRRIPLARREAADTAIVDMLRADFIEPSDSPWSAPVVMVPKKGGKLRFCVDYRGLNSVTTKDSYPLPRIDESLDHVRGSSWFSSLDLRSGYWQVPLSPGAREKTAFSTDRGHWQFKVLCFGLCNAPATFERLMDRVLAGVPRDECVVYLDDILVHGTSFEGALGAIRRVLERISGAGLKLHPGKCHFMQREVAFLGHQLGGEGISTMPDKVEAVRGWPVPGGKKEVKSFLGLASYYRRFVKGFAGVAAPLNHLLKEDTVFQWTEEHQRAFEALKRALMEAPVLASPDPNRPFILDTDASNEGLGAVLAQRGPDGEHVVAYYSRTFDKAEKRYCVTRRELLAVVAAVRHFKYYLGGLPFVVRTDHSALQWLLSFKEPEGQIARWLEELQPYDFQVEHRAGLRHSNADALSRRPCAEDGCGYCAKRVERERELCREEGVTATVSQLRVTECRELEAVDVGEWRRRQEEDAELRSVLRWVEERRRPPWGEVAPLSPVTKGLWAKFTVLRVAEGVLQRGWKKPATGEITWQVVVPKRLQGSVLQQLHGGVGAGHFGVSKTLKRVRKGFYWARHRRDVEDFCRQCDECAAKKGPPGQSHALLQQFPVGEPMERLGVDIVGPFPTTDSGNRWILTAMDYFTKWPEAYALPDQEAATVADALVGGIISRFGVPQSIHSDQGRNFESRVFSELCRRLGAEKTRTTPLHPQSDGLVERFNRTLAQQLAIVTSKHQRDWDTHLPFILMACRSAVQESTACSPALLMLGRELRTPAELTFGHPPDNDDGVLPGPNYRKKGRCLKLDSAWVGPCLVIERVGEVTYRVEVPPRSRKVVVHRDRLAPYRGRKTVGNGSEVSDVSPREQSNEETLAQPEPGMGAASSEGAGNDIGADECSGGSPVRATGRPKRLMRPPGRFKDFVV